VSGLDSLYERFSQLCSSGTEAALENDMAKRKQAEIHDEPETKSKRKKRPLRRLLFLTIVGGGIALVVSPSLRSKALDKLFGAENEFQYSPPPPSPAAPAAPAAADDQSASA
jgi:hypothetical protein